MSKQNPESYSDVFEKYTIKELLKIQRNINKEILRRIESNGSF